MVVGNRWKGKLRGGLSLQTHIYSHRRAHTHTITEAQVGVLNTISAGSFGLLPYTFRNSLLPATHFLHPVSSFHRLACFGPNLNIFPFSFLLTLLSFLSYHSLLFCRPIKTQGSFSPLLNPLTNNYLQFFCMN